MTEELKDNTPLLDPAKPIDMEIFFKAPLDDIDEYCLARETFLKKQLPPEKQKNAKLKTEDFLPEINSGLTSALIDSSRKYGMSKRSNILSLRVAYDLVEKKDRTILMERLPEEAIYSIGVMGQAIKMIGQTMVGFPGNGDMPTGEEIRQLDPKALEDMPAELRKQLLEVISELKKKLEEGGASY
jgi:hypothetical protein